jgi:hypothetical protein
MNTDPVAREVPGLKYFEIDGAHGQRFFRCDLHRCSISVASCSQRWERAQRAIGQDADRFEKCRGCPLGAVHSGRSAVHYSPIYAAALCPRTRQWTNRMIFNRIGVAQRNREIEFLKQRNGKNTPPQFRFDPRRLAVIIDGARQELRDDLTADLTEMVVQVLRTVPGRLVFTRARVGAPAISTIELAERYRPKGDERHQMGRYRQRQRTEIANEARRLRHAEAPVVAAAE